jgi:hypothetical protein
MRPIVLLALLYLGAPLVAQADPGGMEAYVASSYGYCDAKALAGHWGLSLGDAKVRIGDKFGAGSNELLRHHLSQAQLGARQHETWRCRWHEMPFSYSDAQLLAKYWSTTPTEAKGRAEVKAIDGGTALIRQVLDLAKLAHPPVDSCHVKLLSQLWTTSKADTVTRYEQKAAGGGQALIDSVLGTARVHATETNSHCSLADTPYSVDDARVLSMMWDTTVEGASARIESKYAAGQEAFVKDEWRRVNTVQ